MLACEPAIETDPWNTLEDFGEHEEVVERSDSEEFEEAVKFFNANKERLVKDYKNKFIAIVDNEVVDFDEDFSGLAERVYKKYGYRSIYMPKVTREPEVAHIPTPFLRK